MVIGVVDGRGAEAKGGEMDDKRRIAESEAGEGETRTV